MIPSMEIEYYATEMAHLYLDMMGYTSENIGPELAKNLKKKLYHDIKRETQKYPGFNLFDWYRRNLSADSQIPHIPLNSRTPYDLIEGVSDEHEYRHAMKNAGFSNYNATRGGLPGMYDNTDDALNSVILHIYAEKPEEK